MRIPFGKYKGKPLDKIPDDYLAWCLDNVTKLSPTLRRAIEQQLGIVANGGGLSIVTNVIGSWYRTLAREFHPDHGGNHEAMKAVNRGRELLLRLTEATR